jgi:hypothetical protein
LLLEWTETGESATMLAGLERLSETVAAEYAPVLIPRRALTAST